MLTDCYRIEHPKFQIAKEAWEAKKKEWIKSPSSNSTVSEQPPSPPLRPLVLVEEPTYEGIVKYYSADGQPSIGLFSDEGGRFFGGHAMNRDNRLKTLARTVVSLGWQRNFADEGGRWRHAPLWEKTFSSLDDARSCSQPTHK